MVWCGGYKGRERHRRLFFGVVCVEILPGIDGIDDDGSKSEANRPAKMSVRENEKGGGEMK